MSKKVDALGAAVLLLCESFNREATEVVIEAYRMGLDDIPLEAIKKAVVTAIKTCRFMPTVSELRELTGEIKVEDRAVLAFAALNKAIDQHHYIRSVDFDDRAINATINTLGGWEAICDTPQKEWNTFFRKRFIDTYVAYTRSGRIGESAGAPCVGFIDRENHFNGFNTNNLVRIETGLPLTHEAAPQPLRVRGQRAGDLPKKIGDFLDETGQPPNDDT